MTGSTRDIIAQYLMQRMATGGGQPPPLTELQNYSGEKAGLQTDWDTGKAEAMGRLNEPYQPSTLDKVLKYGGMAAMGLGALGVGGKKAAGPLGFAAGALPGFAGEGRRRHETQAGRDYMTDTAYLQAQYGGQMGEIEGNQEFQGEQFGWDKEAFDQWLAKQGLLQKAMKLKREEDQYGPGGSKWDKQAGIYRNYYKAIEKFNKGLSRKDLTPGERHGFDWVDKTWSPNQMGRGFGAGVPDMKPPPPSTEMGDTDIRRARKYAAGRLKHFGGEFDVGAGTAGTPQSRAESFDLLEEIPAGPSRWQAGKQEALMGGLQKNVPVDWWFDKQAPNTGLAATADSGYFWSHPDSVQKWIDSESGYRQQFPEAIPDTTARDKAMGAMGGQDPQRYALESGFQSIDEAVTFAIQLFKTGQLSQEQYDETMRKLGR